MAGLTHYRSHSQGIASVLERVSLIVTACNSSNTTMMTTTTKKEREAEGVTMGGKTTRLTTSSKNPWPC